MRRPPWSWISMTLPGMPRHITLALLAAVPGPRAEPSRADGGLTVADAPVVDGDLLVDVDDEPVACQQVEKRIPQPCILEHPARDADGADPRRLPGFGCQLPGRLHDGALEAGSQH